MAQSKRNDFSAGILELSNLSKTFAHPARLMIVSVLSQHKDRTCKELVADLPLSQPTVSQHLKELLETGLICRKQKGAQSLYCMEWNGFERYITLCERFNSRVMQHRPKRNCC